MANFHMNGVREFADELMKLGANIDEVAVQMVDEAADIMDEKLRDGILKQTTKYGTGTLAASIHHNKPARSDLGVFSTSTAKGTDTRGKKKVSQETVINGKSRGHRKLNPKSAVRNQDKLWYLEYGNSRQPATPVIQKCVNEAEPAVLDKMQEVYNRMTGE